MSKVIISSTLLLKAIRKDVSNDSQQHFPVIGEYNELFIGGHKPIQCVTQGNFHATVSIRSYMQLLRFLNLIEEQPITISFHNGRVNVHEAIL